MERFISTTGDKRNDNGNDGEANTLHGVTPSSNWSNPQAGHSLDIEETYFTIDSPRVVGL